MFFLAKNNMYCVFSILSLSSFVQDRQSVYRNLKWKSAGSTFKFQIAGDNFQLYSRSTLVRVIY